MTTNTLVIPVYNNADGIPALFAALDDLSAKLDGDLEVVIVIDGSPDNSGELAIQAPRRFQARIIFHSRNFGAFAAIRTGMEHARGQHIAAMAADLQEPPELILKFFAILRHDEADVVFGQRTGRTDPLAARLLSSLFWAVYRRIALRAMPPGGVDIFACNRKVADAVLAIEEPNSSLIAQLFWVGFRRRFVPYSRRPRAHGRSSWSLSRRFRYMLDSIFSFTDLPIIAALWLGAAGCLASIVIGVVTLIASLTGHINEPGYTTIVVLIVFFGSLILLLQGVLGSYLWRAFENTKRRPLRIISHIVEDRAGE